MFPTSSRFVLERLIYLACAAVSLTLAYFGMKIGAESLASGETDIRSIDMPRWILFSSIGIGFALIGIEFVLLIVGRGSLYRGDENQRNIV